MSFVQNSCPFHWILSTRTLNLQCNSSFIDSACIVYVAHTTECHISLSCTSNAYSINNKKQQQSEPFPLYEGKNRMHIVWCGFKRAHCYQRWFRLLSLHRWAYTICMSLQSHRSDNKPSGYIQLSCFLYFISFLFLWIRIVYVLIVYACGIYID